jgi:surface carbohydrate biosynthesis protein (TIGR04326 family)
MILYFSEMHAWEKALNIAADENGINKVIGYQHANIPLLLTMYFNSKNELKLGGNIQNVPKPNYLACVGQVAARLFKDSGWADDKVFVWGAIRFQRLVQCLKSTISWDIRKNNVVVALSINPNESKEVLRYVHKAFSNQKDYMVFIKSHPASPVQPVLESENLVFDNTIFDFVDTPLPELFSTAKSTIVTESSASLESIANMCPIVVPHLATVVDMNPFSGISDIPFYVNSPHELKCVVDEIMSAKESPLNYDECRKFIESYFEFLDTDDEYLERLENLVFD